MEKLLAGYHNFRANHWPEQRKLFESLAFQGQQPRALIVSCIDSRVDPSVIFNVGPGEILTIRNVANLVPPYNPDATYHGTSSALEFGIKILGIPQLVVLGHSSCGGVRALLSGVDSGSNETNDFIAPWMSIADSARRSALECINPAEQQQCCELEVVKTSLANLMSFPWIAERVAAGKLVIHGAWFSIGTGILMTLKPDGSFAPAEPLEIPSP